MQQTINKSETPAPPSTRLALVMDKALSPRMVQVLTLVAEGKTHDQVADTLGISNSSVRHHINKARARLGAGSRSEAIAIASAFGLINVAGSRA